MKAQRPKSKPKRPKWKTQKKWTTKKPIKGNEGQERQDEIKAHKATMKDQNERKYIPQQKLTANKPLKIGPKLQSNGRPKVVQPNIFRGPTSLFFVVLFGIQGPRIHAPRIFQSPFLLTEIRLQESENQGRVWSRKCLTLVAFCAGFLHGKKRHPS